MWRNTKQPAGIYETSRESRIEKWKCCFQGLPLFVAAAAAFFIPNYFAAGSTASTACDVG